MSSLRRRPVRLLAAALAAALVALALGTGRGHPRAHTYYVSPRGHDRAAGTSPRTAWRSVGRAERAARAGDTVRFAAGGRWRQTLTPLRNGAAGRPITYGAYGRGRPPQLDGGIYLRDSAWLVFRSLAISHAAQGICASAAGSGSRHVVVRNLAISHVGIGINSANPGDGDWTIERNVVTDTQDSGLILLGARMVVRDNDIVATGLSQTISYGKHGIYAKGPDQQLLDNTIRGFQSNGISIRYPDALVEGNRISGGPIGIGYFQDSSQSGTSQILGNTISGVDSAGIYLDGSTSERFVISRNTIHVDGGAGLNLKQVPQLTLNWNRVSGPASVDLAVDQPTDGYAESDDTWAANSFSWSGQSLGLDGYRLASRQGEGDRIGP